MSLRDWVSEPSQVATATSATSATDTGSCVARVARVAVANTAGQKTACANDTCAGWPRDEQSGAPFCPWGPRVTSAMLNAWRCELRELVAELARAEAWSDEQHEHIMYRIEHQPGLASLRDDISHFRDRLTAERRGAPEAPNVWRCEGLDARHYCAGCNGACIATRQRCTRGPLAKPKDH